MLGVGEGMNKKGRLHREWLDDIEQLCQESSMYKHHRTAHVRDLWNTVVVKASSAYGRRIHD